MCWGPTPGVWEFGGAQCRATLAPRMDNSDRLQMPCNGSTWSPTHWTFIALSALLMVTCAKKTPAPAPTPSTPPTATATPAPPAAKPEVAAPSAPKTPPPPPAPPKPKFADDDFSPAANKWRWEQEDKVRQAWIGDLFKPGAAAVLPVSTDRFSSVEYCSDGCFWASADEQRLACLSLDVCEGCMGCELYIRDLAGKVLQTFKIYDTEDMPQALALARKTLKDGGFAVPAKRDESIASISGDTLTVTHEGKVHQRALPSLAKEQLPRWVELRKGKGEYLPDNWEDAAKITDKARRAKCCGHSVDGVSWLPKARRLVVALTSRCSFSSQPEPLECFDPDYNEENDTHSGVHHEVIDVDAKPTPAPPSRPASKPASPAVKSPKRPSAASPSRPASRAPARPSAPSRPVNR